MNCCHNVSQSICFVCNPLGLINITYIRVHGINIAIEKCGICSCTEKDKIIPMPVCVHSVHKKFNCEKCNEQEEKFNQVGFKGNLDFLKDYILAQNKKVDDLSRIIEKLERSLKEMRQVYNADLFYNEKRIGQLEKNISNWEEEFYFLKDKLRKQNSKPHKCPVCDGKGNIKKEVEPRILSFEACIPCKCTGIIWQ